jgi:hypothetical protein
VLAKRATILKLSKPADGLMAIGVVFARDFQCRFAAPIRIVKGKRLEYHSREQKRLEYYSYNKKD